MSVTEKINEWLENWFKEEEPVLESRRFEPVFGAPEDTKLPKRGSKGSAGYDFYAPCDIKVPAKGFSDLVFFNVKAYMPEDEFLQMIIRSGLAVRHNIMLCTSGVIDSDYVDNPNNDGNIGIRFVNLGNEDYVIEKGERCCQGIFLNYYLIDTDDCEEERIGGYGSSGRK